MQTIASLFSQMQIFSLCGSFVILLFSVHCFEGITLVLITPAGLLFSYFTFHDISISFTFFDANDSDQIRD